MGKDYIYKIGTENYVETYEVQEWVAKNICIEFDYDGHGRGGCDDSVIEEMKKLTVKYPDIKFIFISCCNDYTDLEIYSLYQGEVNLTETITAPTVNNDQYRIDYRICIDLKYPL